MGIASPLYPFLGTPKTTFKARTTDLNCDDDDGAGVDLPLSRQWVLLSPFFCRSLP